MSIIREAVKRKGTRDFGNKVLRIGNEARRQIGLSEMTAHLLMDEDGLLP